MDRGGETAGGWVLRAVLTLALALTFLLARPMSSPLLAQSFDFTSVTVEGNANVNSATVLSYAHIAKNTPLSEADLNDIYQRIVASGLFQDVVLTPQGNALIIKVTEYPIVNVIDFQGNQRVKDADLTAVIKSQTAHVYSPTQATADAAAIAAYYRDHGRIAATVDPKIIRRSNNRVDLVFEIKEGHVSELERVQFIGNKAFSDYRLRQVLATKQAGLLRTFVQRDTLLPARLAADKQLLTDFYHARGYMDFRILDVSAELSRQRDAVFLTFTIQEGQSFRVGAVNTVSQINGVDAAPFAKAARLHSGGTYNPAAVDNDVTRLETLAIDRQINFVTVDPVLTRHDARGLVDVTFTLKQSERVFVERIDIEGNTTTLDQVIRRQFDIVEGDPFNVREISLAADRIRKLGYFSNVSVTAQPGSAPDKVVIKVKVTEQPTGTLSFGATYGVSNGFGLNLGFNETNFLGRGQTLSLSVQTGTSSVNSHLNFTEPALLGRNLQFSTNLGYLTSQHSHANYDTRTLSFQPGINFPLGETGRLGLHYRAAQEALTNVDPYDPLATPPTGSSTILSNEQGTQWESGVGYNYSYDSRRTGLDPNNTMLLQFGQDFVGLGGDATYVETTGLAMAETKVAHEAVTLRTVLQAGVLTGISGYGTRVTDRFFGNGKIRGFQPNGIGPRDLTAPNQDALGGNIYAVARFESDFPLGLPTEYGITGGAFLDVGSVWGLNDTAGTTGPVDASMHLRSSIGVSLFWTTPIGPLRFDFSHVLLKQSYDQVQNFDLTIATQF